MEERYGWFTERGTGPGAKGIRDPLKKSFSLGKSNVLLKSRDVLILILKYRVSADTKSELIFICIIFSLLQLHSSHVCAQGPDVA